MQGHFRTFIVGISRRTDVDDSDGMGEGTIS